MSRLAERTAAIAAKARSAAEATAAKPADGEPVGSGFPLRSWWTVYRWGGHAPISVFVHPPATQLEVRARFYPDSAGVLPHGL